MLATVLASWLRNPGHVTSLLGVSLCSSFIVHQKEKVSLFAFRIRRERNTHASPNHQTGLLMMDHMLLPHLD